MKKRFFAVLSVLVLFFLSNLPVSLAAGSTYVGTWVCVAVSLEGGVMYTEIAGQKVSDILAMELKADGTAVSDSSGEEVTGTWEEVGVGVTVTSDGETAVFTFENNQLVIRGDGMSVYMEKEEQEPETGGQHSLVLEDNYVGQWVAAAMDEGDGELFTEIDGVKVSDMMSLTINEDGTMMFFFDGEQQTVPWQEADGGISTDMWGEAFTMHLKDGQLVATGVDGHIVYFDRLVPGAETAKPTPAATPVHTKAPAAALDLAGEWKAIAYETMGYTFESSTLFPDGCIVTIYEDGTAKAFITKDYAESLTFTQGDGIIAVSGSQVLDDPKYDEETGRLSMAYGGGVVVIVFEKIEDAMPFATAAPTPEPTVEPALVPFSDTQTITTALFSASFPAEGWVQDESWLSRTADYCGVRMELKDASAATLSAVTLTASREGVKFYRDSIKLLNEYANEAGKTSLEERIIGGIRFVGIAYKNWGVKYLEYIARVPESSVTLWVKVEEPLAAIGDLQSILDSITFSLPKLSVPNVDPPLPEDGTPYVPTPTTLPIGKGEVTAAWMKTDASIVVDDMIRYQVAMSGKQLLALISNSNHIALGANQLYALTGNRLLSYRIDDSEPGALSLRYFDMMKLDDKYEYLSRTKDGTLYVSQGRNNVTALKEGANAVVSDVSGNVVMHPDGEWGISFWADSDTHLVRAKDGVLTEEPWVLANLSDPNSRKGRFSMIYCVSISQDRIYVAGTDAQNQDAQLVSAFDLDGKELFTVGAANWKDDDGMVFVPGIVETKQGFWVLDGNSRELRLFDLKGKFIGMAECDELLGTSNSLPCGMIPAEDGGVLVAAVQTRQDESADELLVFHVTGF